MSEINNCIVIGSSLINLRHITDADLDPKGKDLVILFKDNEDTIFLYGGEATAFRNYVKNNALVLPVENLTQTKEEEP